MFYDAFASAFRRIQTGFPVEKLDQIVDAPLASQPLPQTCRPHPLKGAWKGYHECHITADWLLIYQQLPDEVLLARTGTHSDLFDE